MEKSLKNMRIYYTNIRGIKSKKKSLKAIVEQYKPDVIGIVETHLGEKEKFELEGYEMWRNDRNEEGGGVAVAVKNKYQHLVIEIAR